MQAELTTWPTDVKRHSCHRREVGQRQDGDRHALIMKVPRVHFRVMSGSVPLAWLPSVASAGLVKEEATSPLEVRHLADWSPSLAEAEKDWCTATWLPDHSAPTHGEFCTSKSDSSSGTGVATYRGTDEQHDHCSSGPNLREDQTLPSSMSEQLANDET